MGVTSVSRTTARTIIWCGLLLLTSTTLSACQHVQEPWVTVGKQYKEQKFKSDVSNQKLDHRIMYTQVDR